MSVREGSGGLVGVLHIHTTYSDGEFAPDELRRALLEEGCRFACLTDHAEDFDTAKAAAFRAECASLSDSEFLLLPGLEFECEDRFHVLGYGCTSLTTDRDAQRVIRHIQANGGVAVLAHPLEAHLAGLEGLAALNGIEVWNSKYDGRYAPRLTPFDAVRRVRATGRNLFGFYGLDLHWRTQFRGLKIRLESDTLEGTALLAGLRAGEFAGVSRNLEFASNGQLSGKERAVLRLRHHASEGLRGFLRGGKRLAARLGIKVPGQLKSQLRRIM